MEDSVNSGVFKNSIVYLLVLLAVAALIFSIFSETVDTKEIEVTTIAADIKQGLVKKIRIDQDQSLS